MVYLLNEDKKPEEQVMAFPPLPIHHQDIDRYSAFGWQLDEDLLVKRAHDNVSFPMPPYDRDRFMGEDDIGLEVVREQTGWRFLDKVQVLPLDTISPPPLEELTDEACIVVIAMMWNVNDAFCQRRPTVDQYERLKSIFGREGEWFIDAGPKNYWPSHCIDHIT